MKMFLGQLVTVCHSVEIQPGVHKSTYVKAENVEISGVDLQTSWIEPSPFLHTCARHSHVRCGLFSAVV